MSTTFYGETADGERIALDFDHPAYLNLACGNARAFLGFLGFDAGEDLCGEIDIHEARQAIIRAQASFTRRAGDFTRTASDTKRPGRVRVVVAGIDDNYLARRLDDFKRFILVVTEMGAKRIAWA